MSINAVLLMETDTARVVLELAAAAGLTLSARSVADAEALAHACDESVDLLLSFATSVIVPPALLERGGLLALNVHGAAPTFPGRDPHHFAVYRGATVYGATLHFMTRHVDAGPIVDVELRAVDAGSGPKDLLDVGTAAGLVLIGRLFAALRAGRRPEPNPALSWGREKTTRRDFLELCRVDPGMSREEVLRRRRAVAMPGFRNLRIDLHGMSFYLDEDC